jgi:predicted O-methyltransferase YrrM
VSGVLSDPALQALVDRLHEQSVAQEAATGAWFTARAEKGELSWDGLDEKSHRYMADKLVALEPDKAEFCHLMCRALRASRIVEVGTSFGVSTVYLADAVRANGGGVVIGTEYEPAKAAAARATFAEAGLSAFIDLREGDLRETLKMIEGAVDFVLMDIWTEMAGPAIELIAPHLRPGAVIVTDNTARVRHAYQAFFAVIEDPANGFSTMTMPFEGGLEFTVKA